MGAEMNDLFRGGKEGLWEALALILGVIVLLVIIALAAGCAVTDPLKFGMSPAEVHDRWGYPVKINRTNLPGSYREQHVFSVWGSRWYAYFRDGALVGIQQ